MKRLVSYGIICLCIPCLILLGFFMGAGSYAWISLAIALLSCAGLFIGFEGTDHDGKRIISIAVLIVLAVIGRIVFAAVPGFKPITAMVIIAGVYWGREAGFMVGSITAVVSNFYFGQGAWTPFQMFIWGIIGFVAGLIFRKDKVNMPLMGAYGVIAGIVYSLFMDLWSVVWIDGGFNVGRYGALVVSSLPVMAVYAVSNVIFLLLLAKPMGKIFIRLKTKYGI